MNAQHQHKVEHWPYTRTGYGVCSCGATIRVEDGNLRGAWHACPLCVLHAPPRMAEAQGLAGATGER
jgi:hypothetical protein